MTTESFVLAWRPSVAMYERAIRAKRRATRVTWLEWGVGIVGVAWFVPAIIGGAPIGWAGLTLSVLWATGLWGFGYRWLFYWRRRSKTFGDVRQEISAEGIVDKEGAAEQRFAWSHWTTLIYTRDGLMLLTSPKGNAAWLFVPKKGLVGDQAGWPRLVALVQQRVQPHPRASLRTLANLNQPTA